MADATHNSIGHEAENTDIRAVTITGLVLAVGVMVVFLMIYGLFRFLLHHEVAILPASPLAETGEQHFPPSPRIQEHPANEITELHSQEDRILSTYGWMDKKAGVVRIPIDRAMELQLQRGFPVRKEAAKK